MYELWRHGSDVCGTMLRAWILKSKTESSPFAPQEGMPPIQATTRLVLYDIPRKGNKIPEGYSPNTFKTSFALRYKRLPFATEWIEYPDIENKLKTLSVPPNDSALPLMPMPSYTLPALAIYEGDAIGTQRPNKVVMESSLIATFLDETFPARKLVRGTPASQAAQLEFVNLVGGVLGPAISPLLAAFIEPHLRPRSAEYYRRSREAKFGGTLESFISTPEIVERRWVKVEEALGVLEQFLEDNRIAGNEVLTAVDGDGSSKEGGTLEPTYAALVLAAFFQCLNRVGFPYGQERIRKFDNGRWEKVWASCKPYMQRSDALQHHK